MEILGCRTIHKPRATAGEKESGAAGVIPDNMVLWVKSCVSHG